jgi:histidyl-tRNA synthetase
MINPLRGMKDLFFEESMRYQQIITTASQIAQRYGYGYIATPILEETSLFKRSVGESSDIVGKEMYRFEDKGGNDVCLRPEGTAGIVRAFISAKLDRQQQTQRFFYYGPMFRYERPQKGRLRQFHQFGCESFAEASVYEDFTVISMVRQIFDALGIQSRLKINSLGCPECMPPYRKELVGFLTSIESALCEDCQRRIKTNPIRVLDCKNTHCQSLLVTAPKLIDHLCKTCDSDLGQLVRLMDQATIAYEIDTSLVRGLDYYSKTAFEFVNDTIGAQSAIAGGGRYDRLVEFLDGRPTPAVGFAIGIERIMDLVALPDTKREGIYLGSMLPEGVERLMPIANLKRHDQRVIVEYAAKSLKAHLKGADKAGTRLAAIIGQKEYEDATIWVKDLLEGTESVIRIDRF